MAIHAVHPGDGVVRRAGVLPVDGPVDGQHPLVVGGLVGLGCHRLHHPVELAAVVEDPPLRQLLAVCQYRRPGGKQIRHVQGIAVRDGCAGGRIGQHGCAELGRQVRLRLRLGRLLPGRQAHQLAVLYVQVAVARTVPGRLLQLRRYGKPPLQPALRPVALALQAMAAVLPVLNFDDGQHTIPS